MAINATFRVQFGADSDTDANGNPTGTLSAEVDSRPDGLNAGTTQFVPGDTAWFLVSKSANVTYQTPIASAGTIKTGQKNITYEITEDVVFENGNTANAGYPINSVVSTEWMGRSLGSVSKASETEFRAASSGVAIARVTYTTKGDAWGLQSPTSLNGATDFPIVVVIIGTAS